MHSKRVSGLDEWQVGDVGVEDLIESQHLFSNTCLSMVRGLFSIFEEE